MKAIVQDRFGPPAVLELREIDQPQAGDDEVLVAVRAASVNPADWYAMTGAPWVARPLMGVRRPKDRLGVDLAGVVAAVGGNVRRLKVGDEVFGAGTGTLAEYVAVAADALVPKPANLSFEQAAAVPVAGLTALQGLRDKGRVQPGQQVLINGASGGVGTFAVQLAKAFGAAVTGVCSTRNLDLVASLGADQVIDYTNEDFTRTGRRYDLLLDVAGSRPWAACRRVLTPQATLVMVGARSLNGATRWARPRTRCATWAKDTSQGKLVRRAGRRGRRRTPGGPRSRRSRPGSGRRGGHRTRRRGWRACPAPGSPGGRRGRARGPG
jgi:NADPH:quinone reductase-like Zn-dependent oxidoreductase